MWYFKSKKLDFLNGNYNPMADGQKSAATFSFRRLNAVVPMKPMATLRENESLVNYNQLPPSTTTTVVIKKGSLSTPMKNSQSYVEDYCSTSSGSSSSNNVPFNNNCMPSPPSYHVTSSRKNFDNNSPANRAHYYQPQRQCSSPGAVNFCGSGAVSASANLHKLLPNSKSDYLLRQQRLVPYSTSWCSQQPLLELEAVRDFYGVEEQRRIQQQQQHQQQIRKYSSPTRRRMSHSESAGSCVYGRANVQIHQQHQQQIWPTESEQETSFLFNGAGNFGPSSHNGIMTRSFSNNSASHSLASSSGFESLKNNSAHQQQQQQQQSFQPQKNNNLAVGASTFSFSSNSNNSHIGHNFHNSPSFSSSVQSSQCSSSLEKLDELTGSFSSQSSSNQVPNSCGSVKKINIAEMVKCGVSEEEILNIWLHNLRFEEYIPLFYNAGYDIMTISKMTPEDLTAVGVTKPSHRKRLTAEIKRLGLVDNWPVQSPLTLKSWLIDLGLQQYVPWFAAQGYVSVEQILNLAWEDFEDVGVKKLGHLKKLVCAVKKLKDHRRRRNSGRAGNHRSSVCSVDETSSSVSSTSPTFQNGRNDTGGNVDYSGRIGEVLRINVPSGQNSARSTTSGQYSMNSNCDTVSLRSMSSSRSTLLTFNCHPLTDSQDNVRETDILCADYEDRHDQVTPHRNGDFGSQFQKSQNSPSQVEPYSIGSSFCKRSPAKNNFCESLSVLTGRCPDFGDGQSTDAWPPIGSGNFWTSPQNPIIKHQPDRPRLVVKPCSVIYDGSVNGIANPADKNRWPYQYVGDENQKLLHSSETNRVAFGGSEGNSSRPAKEDPIAKFFAARQMVNRSVENYFSAAGANGNAAQRPPGVAVPYPASSSSSYGLPANAAGSLTNSKTSFTLRPGPQQVPNYGFDDAGVGIIVPANEVQKGTLDRKGSKKRSSIITTSSSNSKISPIDTPVIMANPNLEKLLSKKDFDTTNNNSISSSSSSSTTIKKVTFARNELSSPVSFTAANFSSREYVEHQSQNYHQYKNDRDFFLMNQKSPKITTTHHNATNIDGEVLLKKQQHSNDTEIFNAESVA